MKIKPIVLLLCGLLILGKAYSQSVTLSGYVKDNSNGESLPGVAVQLKNTSLGTTTNIYGFYSLSVEPGTYTITYNFVGYEPQEVTLELAESTKQNVELSEGVQLEQVVVSGEKMNKNVTSVRTVQKMDIAEIKKIPAFMGEVDVIKSITMLPGVTTVGEGAPGFNVRGGAIDHNLILLDEASVYSSSHLLGFFSVFSPDAVQSVKLYKGGIPARYGGRLASILDVRMKEGNSKQFSVSGGISSVSSKLTVEGPIIKDKASFIVSGRRSYADLFLAFSPDPDLRNTALYFYDLTGKANYHINEKNRIFVSGYLGRDVFSNDEAFNMAWGNTTGTLRWNHLFTPKLFSNVTLLYSDYMYNLGIPTGATGFDWESHIYNYATKFDFTWYANSNNEIDFGLHYTHHVFEPGKITPLGDGSIFAPFELGKKYANEWGMFVSNQQKMGEKISFEYGIRLSMFNFLGNSADSIYYYEENPNDFRRIGNNPIRENNKWYEFGSGITNYVYPEPRFSMRYQLTTSASIKGSYNRMVQYLHLLSNTTAALPVDLWQPASNNIEPQIADQVALGLFKNFNANQWESSVEVFYKDMQNQIDYIPGAQLLFNPEVEAELLYGRGRAYGLEFFLKKNEGKFTGFVSYTLSRTERLVERINNNQWYPSNFDQPHNLTIVGSYDFNDRFQVSGNFTIISGRPATFPDSRWEYQGMVAPHSTSEARNNYRIPTYHRLDISATYKVKPGQLFGRTFNSEFVLSVYNVYARRNAYGIYFQQGTREVQDGSITRTVNTFDTEAVRLSILGTVLPAITWNFSF